MQQEEKAAWDQYYAAAVIAVASIPLEKTGSPLDSLNSTPMSIANRAATLADLMFEQRKKR
ncbi:MULTISPECIES: hypothetical protein [unclassified Pseudomonas]|uniref:hypothetical protein n=1 Tax=unclassified Pseudomonas TaxID=196821 RepID=UPI000C888E78|nr:MULTISPECIES: hypothetical protein [unclassified Pseudomonas]PNA03527.1 hypothetical protein C1X28_19975 [Pseudomonas sp. FW305-BF15]PNB79332.1 hypothetical protein C1X30_18485 [Pseudomonas sp. FW305-BF6]